MPLTRLSLGLLTVCVSPLEGKPGEGHWHVPVTHAWLAVGHSAYFWGERVRETESRPGTPACSATAGPWGGREQVLWVGEGVLPALQTSRRVLRLGARLWREPCVAQHTGKRWGPDACAGPGRVDEATGEGTGLRRREDGPRLSRPLRESRGSRSWRP